jgi:hypothetical protein
MKANLELKLIDTYIDGRKLEKGAVVKGVVAVGVWFDGVQHDRCQRSFHLLSSTIFGYHILPTILASVLGHESNGLVDLGTNVHGILNFLERSMERLLKYFAVVLKLSNTQLRMSCNMSETKGIRKCHENAVHG